MFPPGSAPTWDAGRSPVRAPDGGGDTGWTASPWIGPGRMIATCTIRSLKHRGCDCQSDCCCARDSIWKRPMVSTLQITSNTRWSSSGKVVEVGPLSRRLLDEVEALRDRRQRAQPEQIHLDEPEILHVVLVELHDDPARHGRPLHRHDIDERFPGHEHAADMNAQMPWCALDATKDADELLPLRGSTRRRPGPAVAGAPPSQLP